MLRSLRRRLRNTRKVALLSCGKRFVIWIKQTQCHVLTGEVAGREKRQVDINY